MLFSEFIWREPANRRYLLAAAGISVLLFGLFKFFYPFPYLVYDSYYYLQVAILDWKAHAWPTGYSRFVEVYGLFSHSATLLVWLQYLLLEFSCLLFFFTWLYFFRPGRTVVLAVFLLLFMNPLFISCSNFLQSDALFITLSILWLTQLCWIICAPRPYMVVTHAILLAAAFTVRYNALYYPLIGAAAFIISRRPIRWKLAGIIIPITLLGWVIYNTSSEIAAITGKRQFSPFSGWKLASNVIYAYPFAQPVKMELVPEKLRSLDSLVRAYFRGPEPDDPHGLTNWDFTYGGFYMFSQYSPLVVYMGRLYGRRDGGKFLKSKGWIEVGPLYEEYGMYFMRQYPGAFMQGYLWPNFLRYCKPMAEVFDDDNPWILHSEQGQGVVEKWFGLRPPTWSRSRMEFSRRFFRQIPIFFTLSHVIFILGFLGFCLTGGFRKLGKPVSFCLAMMGGLWLTDFGFNVFASAVNVRYEIFMLMVEIPFGLYFIEYGSKTKGFHGLKP